MSKQKPREWVLCESAEMPGYFNVLNETPLPSGRQQVRVREVLPKKIQNHDANMKMRSQISVSKKALSILTNLALAELQSMDGERPANPHTRSLKFAVGSVSRAMMKRKE